MHVARLYVMQSLFDGGPQAEKFSVPQSILPKL